MRVAQCVPDECYPSHKSYNGTCKDGYCTGGKCTDPKDGYGCYHIFTETADVFEYELWGCSTQDNFVQNLVMPSGLALGNGKLYVGDYATGNVHVFDLSGKELGHIPVSKRGLAGLEFKCVSDTSCNLYFANAVTNEIGMVSIPNEKSSVASKALLRKSCSTESNYTRPPFNVTHGAGYQNAMVIKYSYGKHCDGFKAGEDVEKTAGKHMADVLACPDRTDCDNTNGDAILMAGYLCHACIPNPCNYLQRSCLDMLPYTCTAGFQCPSNLAQAKKEPLCKYMQKPATTLTTTLAATKTTSTANVGTKARTTSLRTGTGKTAMTSTNHPPLTPGKKVAIVLTLKNLDFDKVTENWIVLTPGKKVAAKWQLIYNIKQAFLKHLPSRYTPASLHVTLSKVSVKSFVPGSVKAQVAITPADGLTISEMLNSLSIAWLTHVKASVLTTVKEMPEVTNLLEEGKTAADLTISATDVFELDMLSTTTTTPVPAEKKVTTVVTLKNLDFDKVIKNSTVKGQLIQNIKHAFLKHLPAQYTLAHLIVSLSKGSVKAQVGITPLAGSPSTDLISSLQAKATHVQDSVITSVKEMPEVTNLLEAGKTTKDLTITATEFVEVDVSRLTTTAMTASKKPSEDVIVVPNTASSGIRATAFLYWSVVMAAHSL